MEFIETAVYTEDAEDLLTKEEQRALQNQLIARPDFGAIIRGTVGLRKMRVGIRGRGKSGGARVIYYWLDKHNQIFLLYIYNKTKQGDLTPEHKKILADLVASLKE